MSKHSFCRMRLFFVACNVHTGYLFNLRKYGSYHTIVAQWLSIKASNMFDKNDKGLGKLLKGYLLLTSISIDFYKIVIFGTLGIEILVLVIVVTS